MPSKEFTPYAVVPKRKQEYPSSIKDIANAAAGIAEGTYSSKEQWQGKGDALRHIVWQAMMAKKYGNTLANAAGQYHELGLGKRFKAADPNQSDAEKEQDLYNNTIGREIAAKATSIEDIYRLAKEAVEKGQAKYLTPEEMQYQAALRDLEIEQSRVQY